MKFRCNRTVGDRCLHRVLRVEEGFNSSNAPEHLEELLSSPKARVPYALFLSQEEKVSRRSYTRKSHEIMLRTL